MSQREQTNIKTHPFGYSLVTLVHQGGEQTECHKNIVLSLSHRDVIHLSTESVAIPFYIIQTQSLIQTCCDFDTNK